MSEYNGIINKLRSLHADNFIVYFKVHQYHFAVQGKTFSQDHSLLNDIYDFLWEQHDVLGEQLRQLDSLPYPTMCTMLEESLVQEVKSLKVTSEAMFADVMSDLQTLIDGVQALYLVSDPCGGCQTVMGDYLKEVSKLHWKVKATLGKSIK